jgi:hypothetical protein
MLIEAGWEGMDWINVVWDGDKFWAVVIKVLSTICMGD